MSLTFHLFSDVFQVSLIALSMGMLLRSLWVEPKASHACEQCNYLADMDSIEKSFSGTENIFFLTDIILKDILV